MTDHRIGLDLFTDVVDVLHRHGFTRGDDTHVGRAVLLIGDLARIYEGTLDYPHVPMSQAPAPPPSGPPGPDSRDPVLIAASDRKTILIALDIAADDMRDRAEMCTDCPDQSCPACQSRLHDARAYDQLADRMLPAAEASRTGPARQSTPGTAHPFARQQPQTTADKEAGQ